MKNVFLFVMLALLASCGSEHDVTAPIPTELQGGTWIYTDTNNTTTELVFNANNTLDISTTISGNTVTETYSLIPRTERTFFVSRGANYYKTWALPFSGAINVNSLEFCIWGPNLGDSANCKVYTR